MTPPTLSYSGYRFPPEIISHAVWLYHRFCLSFRDVEDLLAERGVTVSYEAIRQWCQTFGLDYARRLRRRQGRLGDTWHLDELFVTIQGRRQYLWRAVDQDGDVIDILVQSRRDRRAAARFFRKLLKGRGREPRRLITDKLCSYAVAHRTVMPSVVHSTRRYENNRAEVSHQPTRRCLLQADRAARPRPLSQLSECADGSGFGALHASPLPPSPIVALTACGSRVVAGSRGIGGGFTGLARSAGAHRRPRPSASTGARLALRALPGCVA